MKTHHTKQGDEFWSEYHSIPNKDGKLSSWHDAWSLITPKQTEDETLKDAWRIVRQLAQWLDANRSKEVPVFRIIVGWSKTVRDQQGQIFKIWEPNKELPFIYLSESYQSYITLRKKEFILLRGWQRDVFLNKTIS